MLRNPLIAVVDDDPAVRESMRALLKSIGYAASAYASAEDLLASSFLGRTACIITDVRMPGMSGIELYVRLKDGGWSIPVILISAFSQDGVEAQALAAGVHAFLKKPCSQKTLVEKLWSALGDGQDIRA